MLHNLRHAARVLRRAPLFTLTAVLSLGLGIAGNAAIFSLADAVLLRAKSGLADPDRLVAVGRTDRGDGFDTFSYPNYLDYRARSTDVLDGLAAYRTGEVFGLRGGDRVARVSGGQVSANYFSVLGVPIALGRSFRPEDERIGDPATVIVLGDELWRREFKADPAVVGRVVRLNDRPFTVIGVAAPGFNGHGLAAESLWVPLTAYPNGSDLTRLTQRMSTWLQGIGRLKAGIGVTQADARMRAVAAQVAAEHPEDVPGRGLAVAPAATLPQQVQSAAQAFFVVLFGLVGLILLIAAANVAGILLTRGVTRAREISMRRALGASRADVVSLLVAESLLLAAAGTVVGVAGGWLAIRLLADLVPVLPVDIGIQLRLDARVVTFSALVGLAVGLLCGIVPALQASRTDLISAVRTDAATAPRRTRARQAFIVTQLAMSVLLVVCALLLTRSLQQARELEAGFNPDGVDVVQLDLRLAGFDEAAGQTFAATLLDRLAALPGVEAAASTRVLPLTMEGYSEGRLWPSNAQTPDRVVDADWSIVSPGYFEAIGTPIVRGRGVVASDRGGQPEVAVINETLARRLWPGEEAVGRILVHTDGRRPMQVVGVARDGKYRTLGEISRPFIYVPLAQHYHPELAVLVRSNGRRTISEITAVISGLAPTLPIVRSATLTEMTAFGLIPHRLAATVAAAAGVIALLLASIGVYGVIAFDVAQRTREIGIRLALGAIRREVTTMVLRRSMAMVVTGAVMGLALAGLASQLLDALLFGLAPLDPLSFLGALALILSAAVVAAIIPVRKAVAINPVDALRAE